jgi:hypothetical protein
MFYLNQDCRLILVPFFLEKKECFEAVPGIYIILLHAEEESGQ